MGDESRQLLYFAYGEHLNEEEMLRDFPHARMVGLSTLRGYAFCFAGRDGMARAALAKNPAASVPGRVWALKETDGPALDRLADHPHFARREIRMVEIGGMTVPALVYITAPGQPRGRPGFVTYSILRDAYDAIGEDLGALLLTAGKCAR